MPSVPYAGEGEPQLSRGLSGIFRLKSKSGQPQSVFEAQQAGDTLDAAYGAEPAVPPRQGSKSGRWGILARSNSASTRPAGEGAALAAAAAAAEQQRTARELSAARAECGRQGAELAALRAALQAAEAEARRSRERLNLQRFKYELLVDLWAMRVLDNEEMGAQMEGAAGAAD